MLLSLSIRARRAAMVLLDALVILAVYCLSFLLRFDFAPDADMLATARSTAIYPVAIYLPILALFRVYGGISYYSSFTDLINILRAVAVAALAMTAAILFVRQGVFPRSILTLHPLLAFLGIGGARFFIRWIKTAFNLPRVYSGPAKSVLIIGAGELGEGLLRQMLRTSEAQYRVVGFLDDDPAKCGMRLHGRPVLGGRKDLAAALARFQIDEIIIAIGARRGEIVADIVERLRGADARPELKIAPSIAEMLRSPRRDLTIRKVNPADLLNRGVVRLDEQRIGRFLRGKRVLVTGAGGTIGSELVKQVLGYEPAEIVMLEAHATSLFHVELEARAASRGVRVTPVLGDVRDRALLDRLFAERRPDIVFHAAAHKHLHQIEGNVREGVLNNALATYHLCAAAAASGVSTFLLVSTDKAVKPSSVMGATKRLAEMAVASFAARGRMRCISVRFGNVLGSSGSVLPIFQRQIERGEPLTVSHADVRRYFMTVGEAVGLILQGAAMGRGGEIFLLKMGEPVRILDMARNLILLSGLEPGKDVEIKITGLRQGEKLDEELIEDPSSCGPSEHPDLMILRGENAPLEDADKRFLDLELLLRGGDSTAVVRRLRELVPTFTPDSAHNPGDAAKDARTL